MRIRPVLLALAVLGTGALLSVDRLSAAQGRPRGGAPFERSLPEMDGRKLRVRVVDVYYAPGQVGAPHKHGCAVTVYVIKGAIRMAVRGERDSVYRAGDIFFEKPTDIHQVGANASATDSAHFTATFVCDHEGPFTVPVPAG